jgi:hypothetical protein
VIESSTTFSTNGNRTRSEQPTPKQAGRERKSRLTPDEGAIRQQSVLKEDQTAEVKRQAERRFDSDRSRALRLGKINAMRQAIQVSLSDQLKAQETLRRSLHGHQRFTLQPDRRRVRQPWLRLVPLGLQACLLLLAMAASLANGLYFLKESGLEFAHGWERLSISGIISIAPAVLSKWFFAGLGEADRRRIERVLKKIALPASFAGLAIFAFTLGQMQEVGNLLDVESQPWIPPFWVLLGTSMMLECLASIALFSGVSAEFAQWLPLKPVESKPFLADQKALEAVNQEISYERARLAWLDALEQRLLQEREDFVHRSLALYRLYRTELDTRLAAATATCRRNEIDRFLST